jgi:hypothetical protein
MKSRRLIANHLVGQRGARLICATAYYLTPPLGRIAIGASPIFLLCTNLFLSKRCAALGWLSVKWFTLRAEMLDFRDFLFDTF